MQELYFAYGSNLHSPRMRARVPSAVARGAARLPGRRLTLDKRGSDGSGKANLLPDPEASVWGVVWALDADQWPTLDAFEPGYTRIAVEVWTDRGERLEVWTYVSQQRTAHPLPTARYKRYLVDGAREHGLPAEWIARLEALRAQPGPR